MALIPNSYMVDFRKIMLMLVLVVMMGKNIIAQNYYLPEIRHRFAVGPTFPSFKGDPHTMQKSKPLLGFTINYTTEIELADNSSIFAGLNYNNVGLRFNGYYAVPGYTYVFDGTFPYKHQLRFHTIELPVSIKYNFNVEEDHYFTPYLFLGIGLTYLAAGKTTIVSDSTGTTVYKGKTDLEFEHHLIHRKINCLAQAGFGIQKNSRRTDRAIYIEVIYKYEFPRMHYIGNASNNIFFRNNNFCITAGVKL